MTKTSDTSRELIELTLDELEAARGGSAISEVIKSIGDAASSVSNSGGSSYVWVGCAWVPQWW